MVSITAFYGGLLGLLLLVLTARVILYRRKNSIAFGDADQPQMTALMRAHGNFTETVPMALILMGLAELNGASAVLLHITGAALLAGRLLHGFGVPAKTTPLRWRTYGMILTLVAMLLAALLALLH